MKHENLPTHSPFLVEGTRPPCCRHSDGRPVTRDGRPLTRDGRPATRDGRPVTRDGRPLTRDGHASAASRQVARYRRHRPSYVDEMLFGAPPACIPPHWQTGPCHGDDKDPLRGVSSYRRDSALIQVGATAAAAGVCSINLNGIFVSLCQYKMAFTFRLAQIKKKRFPS